MHPVSLSARFDGRQIVLNEPYELEENADLIVTVLPSHREERAAFHQALLDSGLVKRLATPRTETKNRPDLIEVQGEPVSETILRERR